MPPERVNPAGAYIIKAAESRPARVPSKVPPANWRNEPTEQDRAIARALLRIKDGAS